MMDKQNLSIPGFKASSIKAGLKKDKSPDIALFFSDKEAVAVGVFTTNRVKAAPVLLSMKHIQNGKARAIIAKRDLHITFQRILLLCIHMGCG